jgi:DNA gyrase/topoisomerase IV subunit A
MKKVENNLNYKIENRTYISILKKLKILKGSNLIFDKAQYDFLKDIVNSIKTSKSKEKEIKKNLVLMVLNKEIDETIEIVNKSKNPFLKNVFLLQDRINELKMENLLNNNSQKNTNELNELIEIVKEFNEKIENKLKGGEK